MLARRRPLTDRNEYEIRNPKYQPEINQPAPRERTELYCYYYYGYHYHHQLFGGQPKRTRLAVQDPKQLSRSPDVRLSCQASAKFTQFLPGCRRTLSSFGWSGSKSAARHKPGQNHWSQAQVKQFSKQRLRKSRSFQINAKLKKLKARKIENQVT